MSQESINSQSKVEAVLGRLNSTWDLQFPHFQSRSAYQVQSDSKDYRKQILSLIQYLCRLPESVIDNSIAEFEDEAKVIFSNWIWKPSQEKGTIPSLPKSASLLKHDIMQTPRHEISEGLRDQLLKKLCEILHEEYALAKDSQDYERTSSQVQSSSLSRTTSFATAATNAHPSSQDSSLWQVDEQTSLRTTYKKRRQTSNEPLVQKRSKSRTQTNIPTKPGENIQNFFQQTKASHPHSMGDNSPVVKPTQSTPSVKAGMVQPKDSPAFVSSFDTALSTTQSIFSSIRSDSSSSRYTSMIEQTEETQDYFPTQEAYEILADESFASALDVANTKPFISELSFSDLNAASPFERLEALPAKVCFWLRWEIYRIAQICKIPPMKLYDLAHDKQKGTNLKYSEVWKAWSSLCKELGEKIPPISDVGSWMENTGLYESPEGRSPYFTFNMAYNRNPNARIWTVTLNPIKIDITNRIHRKFGADRHITGYLNYFDKNSLPHWISEKSGFDQNFVFKQIGTWLACSMHHIAGRQWRAFYLEPDKNPKKRKSDEAPRLKMSFFAVSGIDFSRPRQSSQERLQQTISVTDFVNWHLSLMDNLGSTDLKLFSRFGLGLSKTKATVVVELSQFRYHPDIRPDAANDCDSEVMNDGCALMSMGMAISIWSKCGDGSSNLPSAFQGRIGGAKGLWIVDYKDSLLSGDLEDRWIGITNSQLKIKPHPAHRFDADEFQRTFEVLKWSKPCQPGHLNMQLINILVDRGVPRTTLRQILLNDIEEYIDAGERALEDPRLLQAWLQEHHPTDQQEDLSSLEHGLPETREAQSTFLVQSGFDAENCELLRDNVMSLIKQKLDTYVEKLRVGMPNSTSLFCVPDPYQVLDEDEIYLGFSTNWENPRTGLKHNVLHDISVLIARNPAALASDIQKRRAVFKPELQFFKDIIVFPTKGKVPLASLLSGGDYDGDTVTVIWDPNLVDHFDNVNKPLLPSKERCGLAEESRRLVDSASHPLMSDKGVDDFLTACILFNARQNRLGICTNEHEKLIYNGAKLSDQGSILLATLCGYLVDANKQGLTLTEAAWAQLRKTSLNGRKLFPLAYKNGQEKPRRGPNGECVNIIDFLKFDVATNRREAVLRRFEALLAGSLNYDRSLTMRYTQQYDKAIDSNDRERQHTKAVLDDLTTKLDLVIDEWMRRSGRRRNAEVREDFSADVRFISAMIQDITPLQRNCEIYQDFVRSEREVPKINGGSRKGTTWSLLRASTMYKKHGRKKITWWAVGDELCRIKARSLGSTREVVPSMQNLLKANRKLIAKMMVDDMGRESGSDDNFEDAVSE